MQATSVKVMPVKDVGFVLVITGIVKRVCVVSSSITFWKFL